MQPLTFEQAERAIMDARRAHAIEHLPRELNDLTDLLEVLADQDVITVSSWRDRKLYAPTAMHLLLWHLQLHRGQKINLFDGESGELTTKMMVWAARVHFRSAVGQVGQGIQRETARKMTKEAAQALLALMTTT
jgi:hypothetical protein